MPRTYFQCSKLTWLGSNPIGAKLPLRKEAEITMRYGARTNTSRATSNIWEIPSRTILFCWEVIGQARTLLPRQPHRSNGSRAGFACFPQAMGRTRRGGPQALQFLRLRTKTRNRVRRRTPRLDPIARLFGSARPADRVR